MYYINLLQCGNQCKININHSSAEMFIPYIYIYKVVKSYLDKVHNSNNSTPPKDTTIIYFKLPFLNLSNFSQRKVRMLVKRYCKYLQIK